MVTVPVGDMPFRNGILIEFATAIPLRRRAYDEPRAKGRGEPGQTGTSQF